MKLEARGIRRRGSLENVSLSFSCGEIVGLLGPNGAGKGTALQILSGDLQPDEGEVFLDDRPITGLPTADRARMGIRCLSAKSTSDLVPASEGAKLLIVDGIFRADLESDAFKELLPKIRNKSLGILASGFNVRAALGIVDRAYLIYDGRILRSGTPKDLSE